VRREAPLPNHFIVLDANTPDPWARFHGKPADLDKEVKRIVAQFTPAKVIGDVYFDLGTKIGYVVTEGPDNAEDAKAMIESLAALDATVMLRVDEMKNALKNVAPPKPPRRRPPRRS
jgi:hypothetical protein